ncbi:MAG: hypothetical protein RLY78_389 [Pseudomonadota bacterium]
MRRVEPHRPRHHRAPRSCPRLLAAAVLLPWSLSTLAAGYAPLVDDLPLAPSQNGRGAGTAPSLLAARVGELDWAANAAVGRLVLEADRDAAPADGQSGIALTLRVYGRDGQLLTQPVTVTLEASAGRWRVPGAATDEEGPRGRDADPRTPGLQLRVEQGVARVVLLAPAEPADVRLRATAGDEQVHGQLRFGPDLRPMLGAGLVEGVLRVHSGGIEAAERADVFEREIRRWSHDFSGGRASVDGRVAFYFKGVVRGSTLLTAAYDSDKDVRSRLLRDIQPDAWYPVYGDAALRSADARSTERLYLRLDQDRSWALLGDFTTGDGALQAFGVGPGGPSEAAPLKARSLGQWSRTATGVRLHHEADGRVVNGAAFRDSLRQVVEEYASQGSGPYGLRNSGAVEGSEKVEVLVRDRQQPARILSVRTLTRGVDYSFEPFSGRLLLSQYLAAFDAELNPVTLRITYEVDQGGEAFWAGQADAQWRLGERVELGGSLARDSNPLAPYTLASANLGWRFGPRSAVVLEVARSQTTVNTNPVNTATATGLAGVIGEAEGSAWRVELVHEDEGRRVRGHAGRSQPTFANPSAPLTGGRGEAALKAEQRLAERWTLEAEALSSEDRNPDGGHYGAGGVGVRWQAAERLSLAVGLRRQRETVGTTGQASTAPWNSTAGLGSSLGSGAGGGLLGYGNQALDTATGLPAISGSSLGATASSLPAGTRLESDSLRLGLGWRATERWTLGAEAEQDIAGEDRRRLGALAQYQWSERSRLYGRGEWQQGWVQSAGASATGRSAHVLAFGVDSRWLHDGGSDGAGAETQVFSEYRLRDSLSARDAQLASGIRHGWQPAAGWRANAGYERLQVVSGDTASGQAVFGGLDYTGVALWKAGSRLEHRRSGDVDGTPADERFHTTLAQVWGARKLDRDWTLLLREYLLYTGYAAKGDVAQHRAQAGLAWRPVDHNRWNLLGRLEHKREVDASNAEVGRLESQAVIAAVVADWHPSRPWWWTGRVATKWQTDQFEGGVRDRFRSHLIGGRVVWDWRERWDLGLGTALQFGRHGALQQAWGVEAGWQAQTNLWLSAGWNWSGFRADSDLAGAEYTRRGAFVRLRFKFDETLFKRGDPEVNRSLDR